MKMEIPSQTAGAGGGGGGWERSWIGGALMEEQNRLLMALEVLVLVVLVLVRVHVHVIAVMVDDYEVGGDYVVGYYEEKALARLIRLAVV